jgi:hypothetical protein
MTTEREYQEGQDRIRRAQGQRQLLKSCSGYSYGSANTRRRFAPPIQSERWTGQQIVAWAIAAIVGIAIVGNVLPLVFAGDRAHHRLPRNEFPLGQDGTNL